MEDDLKIMENFGIVYYSINIKCEKDIDGKWITKKDYPDRLFKKPFGLPLFKDKKINMKYNPNCNGTIVPMGEVYNLIGIDIDNKDDTLVVYDEICKKNKFDRNTFTMKTMNDGYHEYYHLTEIQVEALKNFCSIDGKIFGLNIDVKYTNQILFGPSIIKADNTYKYSILHKVKPILLPDFIFNEIIEKADITIKKNKTESNDNIKKINKKMDKSIATKEKVIKENEKIDDDYMFIENNNDIVQMTQNRDNEIDKRLEKYFDCLNVSRIDDYKEWIKIGFIIFNENGTCNLYDKISRKSEKYDGSCTEKWNTFSESTEEGKHATLNSLVKMAKEDNLKKYIDALLHDKESILDKILYDGITDVTCAYLFYCLRPESYIYDVNNKDWYKINEYGIYQKDTNNILLKDHINQILLIEIEKWYNKKYSMIKNADVLKKIRNNFICAKKYLLCNRIKQNLINELGLLYKHHNIYEQMDNINNYVFAFKNGVYNLQTGNFRNAKPDELITCTTGYDYTNAQQAIIDILNNIIKDIFPNEAERSYVLTSISLGLIGNNFLELFFIWIGNGRNGKGILRDLIMFTLGGYFDSAEIEYFCKTKHQGHSNSADSIMARKKNSRMVISTEPESDVCLRGAKLKQLSGQDPVQVREMYKELFNFVPKFKLIIQTNEKLEIDGSDGGVIDRLVLISFPNKFVDDPKLTSERKIDRTLKNKVKNIEYRLAFFQILLTHYNDFVKNNNILVMPPRFKMETQDFLDENDPIKQFLEDTIEITNNKKDKIASSTLYTSFTSFIEGKNKVISCMNFKDKLKKKNILSKRTEKGIFFLGIKYKIKKEVNMFINNLDA